MACWEKDLTFKETMDETLDPKDWETMRELGHRMIDDMVDHMKSLRDQPGWRHAPVEVKRHFDYPVPQNPQEPTEIYEEFKHYVLPYPMGVSHPRF